MWEAWDLAVDMCLSQLRGILEHDRPYVPSTFFEEQLTAFEVWVAQGSEDRAPPEQLPIVLQVLLSQAHRLRALDLLGRFLDLGPWAVNLALSVGIFSSSSRWTLGPMWPALEPLMTNHLSATLMGVVRQEEKRSAGSSGAMGSSWSLAQAASWMQERNEGGEGTWDKW